MMNGAFAGLAGITAASGYVPSQAALVMGIVIGCTSWRVCAWVKRDMGVDDVLDVFSLQAVPGKQCLVVRYQ